MKYLILVKQSTMDADIEYMFTDIQLSLEDCAGMSIYDIYTNTYGTLSNGETQQADW